jgi:serine/threonine protein kinase
MESLKYTPSTVNTTMASQLLEPSIEPSRTRQSRFESHELHTTSANIASRLTASIESRSELTALEFFAQELVTSGLPGPAVVVGEKVFQGQGAQFMVYRQQWMMKHDEDYSLCYDVAVKQPKFQLDPNVRLNLADRHTRHHVHSIHLEILALTHPVLRRHRNIARLLAWSYDLYSYHLPFTLIMELAHSNLANFLQEDHFEKSQALRFSLCQDIADALDTIHSCGLVHGDLKAANVLIFLHRNRVIAKLADFGICIDQSISVDGGHYLQGTRGWQAPEVEYGNSQNASYLVKADNYSFGLIVWTIFLHDGNAPHSSLSITRQTVAITEIETCEELFRTPIRLVILRAVGTLLEPNPADRPESVAILFQRKDADMLRYDMNVP